MSAELLLRQFHRMADASDAISGLRRFVRNLAVTGRLSEQGQSEQVEDDALSLTPASTRSADLPRNWRRAPLGELIEMTYGKGLPASERAAQGRVAVYGSNGIVGWTESALTEHPSIIVGRKGSAGALVIAGGPSWTTDVAYYVIPPSYFDIRFLFLALAALSLDKLGKGVKPGLSRSEAKSLPLPVPPLAEQHRIVAVVDEVMALCAQLEAAQKEREVLRDRLRAASLVRLTSPDDRVVGRAEAQFLLRQSPRLFTKPEHIDEVEKTILNLAVRGKLLLQDPSDESADQLLARIRAVAPDLSSPGPAGNFVAVGDGTRPFPIPDSWEWSDIGSLAHLVRGVSFSASAVSKVAAPGLLACLRSGNVQKSIEWTGLIFVPDEVASPAQRISAGDILISIANSHALVGKAALVETVPHRATFGAFLAAIRPVLISPRYLQIHLATAYSLAAFRTKSAQTTNIANITFGTIRRHPVPVPPLAEQHRIVTKVDELSSICGDLRRAIASAQEARSALLESLLAKRSRQTA